MKITRREVLRQLVTGTGVVAAVATPVGRRIWQVGVQLEEPPLGPGQVRMPDGRIVQLRDFSERDMYDTVTINTTPCKRRWETRFEQVEGHTKRTPLEAGAEMHRQLEEFMRPKPGTVYTEPSPSGEELLCFYAYQMKEVDEALRQMRDHGVRVDWGRLAQHAPDVELGDIAKRAFELGVELHIALRAA